MGIAVETKIKRIYPDAMHSLCPYFAMFPPEFAREAIKKYSKPGDLVVDPFSGRGTTLLEARLLNRIAIANDINPVAVTITAAKSNSLNLKQCLRSIGKLESEFKNSKHQDFLMEAKSLPPFFQHAFNKQTLIQILWLKKRLAGAKTHQMIFIKTLCLSHLHGETQKTKLVYFSNNLPHTYCPRPDYSVRYWKKRKMVAPKIDVFQVLKDRCVFRLSNSKQETIKYPGHSILGDVRELDLNLKKITTQKAKLVVTSPPYIKITSYEEDQWLRLWFLGHQPYPGKGLITKDDKISSIDKYVEFLAASWRSVRNIMDLKGTVVCRIGQSANDNFPLKEIMQQSIQKSGGGFKIVKVNFSSFKKNRQAIMFAGGKIKESGEYDFVLKAI